jgi:hypothetical protein
MHLPHPLRTVGLLAAGVAATLALWVAASPPATSTVAPTVTIGAAGQP